MYNDYDYEFKMSIHEVQMELEAYARKEKRMRENTKVMRSWKGDSYGSASCGSSSFEKIFDAYNDYRMACWSHTYDNGVYDY